MSSDLKFILHQAQTKYEREKQKRNLASREAEEDHATSVLQSVIKHREKEAAKEGGSGQGGVTGQSSFAQAQEPPPISDVTGDASGPNKALSQQAMTTELPGTQTSQQIGPQGKNLVTTESGVNSTRRGVPGGLLDLLGMGTTETPFENKSSQILPSHISGMDQRSTLAAASAVDNGGVIDKGLLGSIQKDYTPGEQALIARQTKIKMGEITQRRTATQVEAGKQATGTYIAEGGKMTPEAFKVLQAYSSMSGKSPKEVAQIQGSLHTLMENTPVNIAAREAAQTARDTKETDLAIKEVKLGADRVAKKLSDIDLLNAEGERDVIAAEAASTGLVNAAGLREGLTVKQTSDLLNELTLDGNSASWDASTKENAVELQMSQIYNGGAVTFYEDGTWNDKMFTRPAEDVVNDIVLIHSRGLDKNGEVTRDQSKIDPDETLRGRIAAAKRLSPILNVVPPDPGEIDWRSEALEGSVNILGATALRKLAMGVDAYDQENNTTTLNYKSITGEPGRAVDRTPVPNRVAIPQRAPKPGEVGEPTGTGPRTKESTARDVANFVKGGIGAMAEDIKSGKATFRDNIENSEISKIFRAFKDQLGREE